VTTPIGSASITVQAVTDAFQNSLTRDTDRVLDSLERNFDRTWDNLRHTVENNTDLIVVSINDASREIQQTMRDTAASIERSFDRAADRSADRLEASFSQAARDIAASFEGASERSADRMEAALNEIRMEVQRTTDAIERDAEDAGDAIGEEITEGVARANLALALLRDGSDRALDSVGRLGNSIEGASGRGAGAFKTLGTAAVAASLGVAAFAQAAAGAVLVMEQLAGVALVAPAAILSFAAVTKTLTVALNGVSEAISASLSDDTEAFVKAMDKLQPAAQEAIRGLSGVIAGFQNLGKVIQQNFFEEIGGSLRAFGEAAEDVARQNLPRLSTVLGRVSAAFLDASVNSGLFDGINAVLGRTVSGVSGLEGPLARLAPAFGSLFGVGAGFIDRMYASLGRLIDRFSNFVTVSADNGDLERWIEDAIAGFRQLGRILGNLGSIFSTLTSSAGQAGVGILATLERVTQAIDEALSSDVGQAFLTASFGLLAQVMESLAIVMGPLVQLFAVFATILAERLTTALQSLEPFLRSVANVLLGFSEELPGVNGQLTEIARSGFGFMADQASRLFDALSPVVPLFDAFVSNVRGLGAGFDSVFLDDLTDALGELGVGLAGGTLDALDSLVAAFAALGEELPTLLRIVGELAEAIGSVLGTALDETVPLFEPLVDILEELTPLIGLTENLLSGTAEVLSGLAEAVAPVVQSFAFLAGMLSDSLNPAITATRSIFASMQPQLQRIGDIVGRALTGAFGGLKPGVDALVQGFIELLPRLSDILPPIERMALAVEPLIVLVGQLAGVLIEKLVPPILTLAKVILDLAIVILEELTPVIEQVSAWLVDNLGPAFEDLLPVVVGVFNGIAEAAEFLERTLGPIFAVFADALSVVLPAALDSAKVAFTVAWDAIVLVVETAWDIISGVFNIIKAVLSGDFAGAWRALENLVVDVFEGIWQFIVNTINNIIDFFTGESIANLASAVSNLFEAAYDAVVRWLTAIWENVTGTFANIVQWIKELPGNIASAAGDAATWLYEMGRDIVKGLIKGLKDAALNIGDVVKDNIIAPVKGFFEGAFDFGSPSKVTTQWGKWIGEGFATGMTDTEAQVVAAAEAITMAAAMPGLTMTGASFVNPTGTSSFTPVASGGPVAAVGTGAVFGPGAIQVVFSGVVPSESQAYATGQSVGAGIADELARRDARVAVGTL
jgi:hypothetical protein